MIPLPKVQPPPPTTKIKKPDGPLSRIRSSPAMGSRPQTIGCSNVSISPN